MKVYGTSEPPSFDIRGIKVPIAMLYGNSDVLADEKDVKKLVDYLEPGAGSNLVYHEMFNMGHMTFHIGKDMSYFNNVLWLLEYWNSDAS